jgi:hypothetical protein
MFVTMTVEAGVETHRLFRKKIESGGEKVFTVRFPTDKEWADYQRSLKFLKPIANTVADGSDNSFERSLDLLSKIAHGDQPQHDGAEAAVVIGSLMRADIEDCVREGATFRVTMKVFGGHKVSHVLRMPTYAARDRYFKAAVSKRAAGRNTETRVFLEPAADFYDELFVSSEGYGPETETPIVHKQRALEEVLRTWGESADEPDPED